MKAFATALLFASIIALLEARGLGRGGSSSSFSGRGGRSSKTQRLFVNNAGAQTSALTGKNVKSTGGSSLSAWGIISLIVIIVFGAVFAYYVSVFYPIVCAERGKYDVMDMTAV